MITYPNAKINIGLNITSKRPDGYHNIETVFYPIPLSDILSIEISETCTEYSLSVSGIETGQESEKNLVIKAYRILQKDYILPPVDITLIKNIPVGAGLGGGSADAAFMLSMLNELAGLKISEKKLESYASKLGADCPVFIRNVPVYAEGIGNEFSPISLSLKNYYLVLIKPDIFVSTPVAYSLVTPREPTENLMKLVQLPVSEWKNVIVNDFESSVFKRFPRIEQIKNQLYADGALYASMSGSGSSVYGIFTDEPQLTYSYDDCFVTGGKLS
jgi:4-diphosphocytidyl-2-C-methyl-D-erythritol kinase